MKVSIKSNVLTVVTNIPMSAMPNGRLDKPATKEEGAYSVEMTSVGEISKFGLKCNSIVNGKAAVVVVLPIKKTSAEYKEYVKQHYGAALNAAKVTDQMAVTAQAYDDELEALIEVEDTETEVTEEVTAQ